MKNVIIFGTGRYYKAREEYLKKTYNIIAFLDNKVEEEEGRKFENTDLIIYNPNHIRQFIKEDIIIMSKSYVAMYEQLKELGVSDERIRFGILIQPNTEKYMNLLKENGRLYISDNKIKYSSDSIREMDIACEEELDEYAAKITRAKKREENPIISIISQMSIKPVSNQYGLERGTPIDRIYVERFLEKSKKVITGKCLEIAENTYTLKYGREVEPFILHVEGWGENVIKGNLETGEGIKEEFFDCVIITQTLMFTYDLKNVAKNIYKMLKTGGTALITVSGIAPISKYDAENWGSYYSFHKDAMRKMFEPLFGEKNVKVESYGNVKTAIGILYGLCYEDLQKNDLDVNDELYPVIIAVQAKKEI